MPSFFLTPNENETFCFLQTLYHSNTPGTFLCMTFPSASQIHPSAANLAGLQLNTLNYCCRSLISVLSIWASQPVQQPQGILKDFTWTKPAKFLKKRKALWMSHGTAQPRKSFSPVTRMVWAERNLKDHPGCPFCSLHRRQFIRENIQLLIMSDGFSFQLRPCHLASDAQKADT